MTKIARTTCKPGSPLDPALGAIAFALFTAAMAFMLFATRVSAQQVGDAREGLSYAQANCAECHAISKGADPSPNADAPRFEDVAKTRGITEVALAVFLRTPHATMPNLIVPNDDMDNVIAYILSLRKPG